MKITNYRLLFSASYKKFARNFLPNAKTHGQYLGHKFAQKMYEIIQNQNMLQVISNEIDSLFIPMGQLIVIGFKSFSSNSYRNN